MTRFVFLALTLLLAACGTGREASSGGAGRLKVMSYNIHIAIPPSKPGVTDMDAIVKTIKNQNPDVVALQEVDVNTNRTGKINEAEVIASRLKMNFFFAKAIDHDGGDYGVAILSKYPISETNIQRLTTLPETKGEPRVLATARITLKNGTSFRFGSTHLDAGGQVTNREKQIAEINAFAAKESLPFILAGDFNATPESPVIREFDQVFTRSCQDCPPTFPVVTPKTVIDYIGFKKTDKLRVVSHALVPEHYASDHLPIVAEIAYSF